MDNNKFLIRMNVLYNELIITDRLRYDGQEYYVKNRQTKQWVKAKVHKGNTISAPTSRGTSCPLSSIQFILENPGPYTLEILVQLVFQRVLHKYFGWLEGFWTNETRKLYFMLLKEKGSLINEHYIKDEHNAFYKSIQKSYSGKQKYRQFLIDMGEDPDDVSGMKNVSKYAVEGKHIESEIIKQLQKISAPFNYGIYFDGTNIPDIYNPATKEVIDIKRSIKTSNHKEIVKYTNHFSKVTIIFLLGSRTIEINTNGIRKVSVFKWIKEQPFFQKLHVTEKEHTINKLEKLVDSINIERAEQDRKDFHRNLVEEIIKLDKMGHSNPEIAEIVGYNYKYINMILNGNALKEFSGNYSSIYKQRQALNKERKSIKIPDKVKMLTLEGKKVKEIACQLSISTDMVKYHLSNQGLNEKALIKKRNSDLYELFSKETNHGTLVDKFRWIVETLKNEYPNLTFTIVKRYYYTKYKKLK